MIQVVTGPMEGTAFLVVEDQTLSIGRSSTNDVTLSYDPWISSAHLQLRNEGDQIFLEDLGSSNGSFVASDKVVPHQLVPIDEYFVLGSTLCRVSGPGPMLAYTPLLLDRDNLPRFRDHPLIRPAHDLARQRRSPVLAVPHLFLALLEMRDKETERYLRSLRIDPTNLRNDLDRYHFFDGKDQWINEFMPYQFRTKQKGDLFFTPQAQAFLERYGPNRDFRPLSFLKVIMDDRYTILFPQLGITGRAATEPRTEKVTLNPFDSEVDDLTLPGDFWSELEREIAGHHVVILTGDKGTGKTAVMEQCFHALPKVDLSCFREGRKRVFDPEMFLVYHEVGDLVPYINTIIKALRENQTIGIDHFGTLLELMHRHNIEDTPLIRTLCRRKHPTLLAVGTRHLDQVREVLNAPGLITMDQRIKEANTEILDSFLRGFEQDTKRTVSARAERFLVDLLSSYNFTAAKSFLDFCADRVRNLNYVYKELIPAEDQRTELSEAFFRYMNDRWTGTLHSLTAKQPRDKDLEAMDLSLPTFLDDDSKSGPIPQDDFPEKVETLLNEILARNFRTAVTFTDNTRSIAESGSLNRARKKAELLRQLELTAGAFRSGFLHWLKAFLKEIDPDKLRQAVGREPRVLWEEYLSRYELLDKRFVRDHFLETARKVFLRKRKEPPGKSAPDSLV